jgi:glutathionyl-hydroquinone reductase
MFRLRHHVRPSLGPPSGHRMLFLRGLKRSERGTDHSVASSAEVKNVWSYTSIPPYAFMAWCSVKRRDSLTFTFTG